MAEYKKEDFRIAYESLYGYWIEKSETTKQYFAEEKAISVEWKFFAHPKMPKNNEGEVGTFVTKQEAIQFIKDLCSETEYYYPPEFENAND